MNASTDVDIDDVAPMRHARGGDKNCLGNNIAGNFFDLASTNWAPTVLFSEQFLGAFVATHLVRDVAMN